MPGATVHDCDGNCNGNGNGNGEDAMSLSSMDDHPVHQVAEVIRHPGTSDRNFYDRYYFNCHGGDPTLPWLIVGLGVYPNLGVTDCFAVLRHGGDHRVFRASRALGAERADLTVGPFRIEVEQGLERLRLVLDDDNEGVSFDLTFTGISPATLEARHFQRRLDRVFIDTMRFVQTGSWSGRLTVADESFDVVPDTWRGNRDRSWGVRPVGEPEPPGRAVTETSGSFFWIYAVIACKDHSIVVLLQETSTGERVVDETQRIWHDRRRPAEWLGRVEHTIEFRPGTREPTAATLVFTRPGGAVTTVGCVPQLANFLGFGTGYGLEQDWRHGMWQGELEVQNNHTLVADLDDTMKLFCPIDHLTEFTVSDGESSEHAQGLFEFAVIGPHEQYGFTDYTDVAE